MLHRAFQSEQQEFEDYVGRSQRRLLEDTVAKIEALEKNKVEMNIAEINEIMAPATTKQLQEQRERIVGRVGSFSAALDQAFLVDAFLLNSIKMIEKLSGEIEEYHAFVAGGQRLDLSSHIARMMGEPFNLLSCSVSKSTSTAKRTVNQ